MRFSMNFCLMVTVALLSGCLYTFHPAYDPADVVSDPQVAGSWLEVKEGDLQWTFEVVDEKTYRVTAREKDEESRPFTGQLFKLGKDTFLDMFPQEREGENFFQDQVVAFHTVYRLCRNGDDLKLQALDPDWGNKMLEEKKIDVEFLQVDDHIKIISSSQTKNRELLLTYADEAFTGKVDIDFKRVKKE